MCLFLLNRAILVLCVGRWVCEWILSIQECYLFVWWMHYFLFLTVSCLELCMICVNLFFKECHWELFFVRDVTAETHFCFQVALFNYCANWDVSLIKGDGFRLSKHCIGHLHYRWQTFEVRSKRTIAELSGGCPFQSIYFLYCVLSGSLFCVCVYSSLS